MMYGTDNGPICRRCGLGGIYTYHPTEGISDRWQEWESACRVCGDRLRFICGRTEDAPTVTIHDLKRAHAAHLARTVLQPAFA